MTKPLALVIEDNDKLSQIFSLTLQTEFEIEAITDGKAALKRLGEIVPDLIILDLHLPNVSGHELLKYVRADARMAKTRVILTTADERQSEALQDLADIVLLKPISPVQLRELATRMKDNPRA
ncbi:MAG: response regulator [Anaerolineales bacterium]|uniref:response regulator n=1 Tax=Candidatus Villigracilis proximus TaxID=3140683 RepID=UPI00313653F8|nr:response regulator [Anaerolineales bacterium]MBK9208966.1 response regulator [Anaerolineales bacterium]